MSAADKSLVIGLRHRCEAPGKAHPATTCRCVPCDAAFRLSSLLNQSTALRLAAVAYRETVVNNRTVTIHEYVMKDILEYSRTLPTGEYAGKRWKRKTDTGWLLGEYIDDGADDGTLLIRWTPIEVVAK